MKILFLSKSFPVFGGVETWLEDLIHGLLEKMDIHLGLAQGAVHNHPSAFLNQHPGLSGAHIHTIDGTSGSQAARQWHVQRLIESVNPDIVIPVLIYDGLAGALAAKRKQAFALVYPVHEYSSGVVADLEAYGQYIDHIVCVDELNKQALSKICHLQQDKLSVIPCGVPSVKKITPQMPSSKIRIGYAGRLLETHKNIYFIVDICIQLEQSNIPFQLEIVGGGPDQTILEEKLAHWVQAKQVIFLESQSRQDLYNNFYPNLDVLLITSYWETGPLVAWEAMMHAVVPITVEYLGLKSAGFLKHNGNALVFQREAPEDAAHYLGDLYANPKKKLRLGQQARMDAMAYRSLDKMLDTWHQFFQDVVHYKSCLYGKVGTQPCGESRLEKLLPISIAELIRRIVKKEAISCTPRSEWPHYRGAADLNLIDKLKQFDQSQV